MSSGNGKEEAPGNIFEQVAQRKAGFFTTLAAILMIAAVVGLGLAFGVSLAGQLGVKLLNIEIKCSLTDKSL